MVKDTLNSILDNIKERTTNPFLGTLIVVWLIKNWTLVYSLFYFDSKLKLKERLDYINTYFATHSFLLNMVFVILITLGVLILTYVLLGISRYLTETYERRLVPKISEWTDETSVVLKVDFVKLQEVIKQLELRLEEERILKVAAQNERDEAYSKLIKLQSPSLREDSESSGNELVDIYKNAKSELLPDKEKVFNRIASSIVEITTVDDFNETISKVLSNALFSKKGKLISLLLRELLIKIVRENNSETAYFTMTDEGLKFLSYWNNIEHSSQS